jgi:hypothetical protein
MPLQKFLTIYHLKRLEVGSFKPKNILKKQVPEFLGTNYRCRYILATESQTSPMAFACKIQVLNGFWVDTQIELP